MARPASKASWQDLFSLESLLSAGLVALLLIIPTRDGSRNLDAQALNAVLVMSMVVILEVSLLLRRRGHALPPALFMGPATLFALGLAWVVIQYMPGVPALLEHPSWQMARETLAKSIPGRITVDPDLTAQGALRLVAAAGMVWLAAQLAASPRRAYGLLIAFIAVEMGFAFYGLIMNGFTGAANGGAPNTIGVTATFSIRNTYATYAGLGLVVAVALAWRLFRHSIRDAGLSARHQVAALIMSAGGTGALWIASIVVLVACLLLSNSRGGVLSTVVALAVLSALTLRRYGTAGKHGQQWIVIAAASAGLAGIMAIVAALGFGNGLLDRVSASGLADAGRPFVYGKTLEAIAASPWLGYGYGTFSAVFPMYDDGTGDPFYAWDLAHNTYLEVLLGSGIPGALLLLVPVIWLVWYCIVGALTRQRDATIPAIAAAASVLVGLHSMVDFSVQYQGVGLTYAAILGIGFAHARGPDVPRSAGASRRAGARETRAKT